VCVCVCVCVCVIDRPGLLSMSEQVETRRPRLLVVRCRLPADVRRYQRLGIPRRRRATYTCPFQRRQHAVLLADTQRNTHHVSTSHHHHHHHHGRVAGEVRRVVAPPCPRSTARLQSFPVGRVESFRSWLDWLE